jgi:hypothetical protein
LWQKIKISLTDPNSLKHEINQEMIKQAGAELCQAQLKMERAKVAVARNKLRTFLLSQSI